MPEKIESLTVNQLMMHLGEWRRFLVTLGEDFSPILLRWLKDWRDWEAKISPREDLRGHLRAAHYRGWMDREPFTETQTAKDPEKPQPPKKPRKKATRKKATGKDKG